MNCKKCGALLAPTDTVCKNCGEPVMPNPQPVPQTPVQNQVPVQPVDNGAQTINPTVSTPNIIPNIVTGPATEPIQQAPSMPQVPTQVEPQPINQGINVVMPQNPGITPVTESTTQPVSTPQVAPTVVPNANIASAPVTTQAEPAQPEKKKNSPILVAILIIALIAIIAFYVIYFLKPFDNKTNGSNAKTPAENTTVETPAETATTQPTWMTYLQGQTITSITLERTTEDASGDKTVTLTIDQLNNLYTKLASYSLVKRYLEGSGFTYGDIITIAYAVGENNYEVKIANGMLVADTESLKDEGLRNALESSEHTTENEDIKDNDGVFYNYVFQNYDSSILDEYFNQNTEETTEEVSN